MSKLESFFNRKIYIAIIFFITYVSWFNFEKTPPYEFNFYNIIGLFFLVLLFSVILILFENTNYIIPIVFSFLFIMSQNDMTFDTLTNQIWPYIPVTIFFLGIIIHFLRFKPKLRFGPLALGFLLIGIAYLIPLVYMPFQMKAIPVSITGMIYFILYLFFSNTVKKNEVFLMTVLMFANLLLTAELFTLIIRGILNNYHTSLLQTIQDGIIENWYRNLGWGNVNDVMFYLALTVPSFGYFIIKNFNNSGYYFLLMLFPIIGLIFAGSRGGFISFGFSMLATFVILIKFKGKEMIKYIILIIISLLMIYLLLFQEINLVIKTLLNMLSSGDLNTISNFRIEMYRQGFNIFLDYPIFGAGWLSIDMVTYNFRLFMFHSTLIQVLATMGLFGLIALIIHYIQVTKYMFHNRSLAILFIAVGYIGTQIHGLVDNVQFSVPYSVIIVLIFSGLLSTGDPISQ